MPVSLLYATVQFVMELLELAIIIVHYVDVVIKNILLYMNCRIIVVVMGVHIYIYVVLSIMGYF